MLEEQKNIHETEKPFKGRKTREDDDGIESQLLFAAAAATTGK